MTRKKEQVRVLSQEQLAAGHLQHVDRHGSRRGGEARAVYLHVYK